MSSKNCSPENWHYHTMKDRDGKLIWSGQYDLCELLHNVGIPDDLKGQSVIDIGKQPDFLRSSAKKEVRYLSLPPNCRESKTGMPAAVSSMTA